MAALSPQKLKISVVFSAGQALGTLSLMDHFCVFPNDLCIVVSWRYTIDL
ncbi:hypothetical protein YC2023_100212 [Brassica napus]